ncbi:hypothetical protein GLOIN_2v1876551 [Rhizophagus clarus]|uniref:Uncharacterized protein n=1 Tax=Rhizophagus clarus TaxID=94130 RepID=A0A8H3LVL6_9GLOM|nr:hypothetical protein GLOIN_2v1876551 [Rhizophagus clarus]
MSKRKANQEIAGLASNRRNNDEREDDDRREKDDGREDEKEREDHEEEKSGSSDNDSDDHDRDKMNMTDDKLVNLDEPIPVGFKSNLEICNFLVAHPHILHLANKMLEMDSGSSSTTSTSSADDNARLWDESIKCLFLRTRNPREETFDELIKKIFKVQIYSTEGKNFLEKTHRAFADYRNKLNQNIEHEINEYKNIRKNRAITGSLSNKEVKDYVDEHFVQKLLNRQLAAVNLSEMKKIGSFDTLIDFIRETFKIFWNGKDLSAVKNLDSITKDIIIPSRSGNRIVNSLEHI